MAMQTRCCWPPESWCGIALDSSFRLRQADEAEQFAVVLRGCLGAGSLAMGKQDLDHLAGRP